MKTARELAPGLAPSLAEYGAQRLELLLDALALPEPERADARALFESVSASWPSQSLSASPPWENDITDDGTPFEFSVGFEGNKPELRLLFESQRALSEPTRWSSWEAGLSLQRALGARVDTALFERIRAVFEPTPTFEPRFSLWHAAVLRPKQRPMFKAYVNPEVRGVEGARALTEQGMAALGAGSAWQFVAQHLGASTRLPYLSVDLEDEAKARLKVYLTASDAEAVERLTAGVSNIAPGQATSWLTQLTSSAGPYPTRPILVCYAFHPGRSAPEATVHVPIRNYAPNDDEALKRTLPLLPGASGRQLSAALKALSRSSLSRSRGVLSYVSLRVVQERVRVTTYLAPGAFTLAGESRESGTIPTGRPSSPPPRS